MTVLACIVEGDGDRAALPLLIRRMCHDAAAPRLDLPQPIRVRKDQFLKAGQEGDACRAKYVGLAADKAGTEGRILVLLDADADCPAELAARWRPVLMRWARQIPMAVVFAKCEFEAWFIAGADTLAERHGIAVTLPPDPEAIRGAKEWVREHLRRGGAYKEAVDQPSFAGRLDWKRARTRSPSLDKLCRDLAMLLGIPELA